MSSSPGRWNRLIRRTGWIIIVFLLQIGLIFWLSGNSKAAIRKASPAPSLSIVSPESNELVALSDPTLFALPHYRTFSGAAWLRPHSVPAQSFEWSDEPGWFQPSRDDFLPGTNSGGAEIEISELVKTAPPAPPRPAVAVPAQFPEKSKLKILGFTRALVSAPSLPAWSTTNLLTNTVVRLMVDANGITRSQTILVRSGLPDADQFALNTSRNLRFAPIRGAISSTNPVAGLTWGEAVFEWLNNDNSEGGKK
jgi:hypothetical protein